MICPRCNIKMSQVMHFETNKQYAYNICPKCRKQTHQKRIHLDEYEKGNKYEKK